MLRHLKLQNIGFLPRNIKGVSTYCHYPVEVSKSSAHWKISRAALIYHRSFSVTPHYLSNVQPSLVHRGPKVDECLSAANSGPSIQGNKIPEQKIKTHEELESAPNSLNTNSPARHMSEDSHVPKTGDHEMTGVIKSELKSIRETFSLREVPRDSLYIGAAGVLPYAASSMSTIYLAWDINHAEMTGNGFIFSSETAHQLLDMIIPIQIGYGAIVRVKLSV